MERQELIDRLKVVEKAIKPGDARIFDIAAAIIYLENPEGVLNGHAQNLLGRIKKDSELMAIEILTEYDPSFSNDSKNNS